MKTASFLLLFSAVVHGEQYSFDFSDFANPKISQPGKDVEPFRHRLLQKGPACAFEGDKLICDHAFEVTSASGEPITIQFTARCDADSQVRFNYQKAANCDCSALVHSLDGSPPKVCPCTVCQAGFGEVPVNVDCTMYEAEYLASKAGNTGSASGETSTTRSGDNVTDSAKIDDTAGTAKIEDPAVANETKAVVSPYVAGTCTSIDCGAACNGTCDLNCANSGTACPYCANAAQNQPTMSPTGGGNGEIPGLNPASGLASGSLILSAFIVSLGLVLL